MEAVGVNEPHSFKRNKLCATSPIPDNLRYPLKSWRPRAGRDDGFVPWDLTVKQLLCSLGLTEQQIQQGPPKRPSATVDTRGATRRESAC